MVAAAVFIGGGQSKNQIWLHEMHWKLFLRFLALLKLVFTLADGVAYSWVVLGLAVEGMMKISRLSVQS